MEAADSTPLLTSASGSPKVPPSSRYTAILPALDVVAEDLKELAAKQPQVELLNKASQGTLEQKKLYHDLMRRDLYAFRTAVLTRLRGGSRLAQLLQIAHAYWHKNTLIKTLQAAEHMLAKTYEAEGSVFTLLRSQLHSVKEASGYGIDYGGVSASQRHADATTQFYAMVVVMLMLGFPARVSERIRASRATNPKLQAKDSVPSGRVEVLATLLSRPVPAGLGGDSMQRWRPYVDSQASTEADEAALDGILVDPSWLCDARMLCDLGCALAWLLELNNTKGWSNQDFNSEGREWTERDAILSYLSSNEYILMNSVQTLMVGIVAELKAQADSVSQMQTKILGTAFSAFFLCFSFAYQSLLEPTVDQQMRDWTEDTLNRTIGVGAP